MNRQAITINRHNQKGVALVIGLIVLLIMTLLGITSMSSTTAELKAASNMQTYNLASEAAETAMNIVLDPIFPVTKIDWTLTSVQPLVHADYYPSDVANNLTDVAGGSLDVPLTVTYTDCSKVPVGYSLTEGGQDGESMFNGMVHDLSVNASVVSTFGTSIGNSKRLRGIQTVVVKCG